MVRAKPGKRGIMQRYEFKVIPAPKRGEKARGVKTTEDRFALALTAMMNQLGAEGWDYIRADTLPCEERSGLTGTKTSYQTMMVFRRALAVAQPEAGAAPPTPLMAVPDAPAPRPEGPRLGSAVEMPAGAAPALGPARVAMP